MAPKQQKAKKRPSSSKKRNKSDSESSVGSSDFSGGKAADADRHLAMSIAEPRKTRASARACTVKMQDESFMDQVMKKAEYKARHSVDKFDFTLLTTSPAYEHPELVRKMTPKEFDMTYYNQTGLNEVLIFDCNPEELGMKMVDADFEPRDVERLVGSNRMISCVRVETQGSEEMKLKDFIEYYYKPKEEKERLYNVLSLEFSNTGLADLVRSPSLVRDIDWAAAWPDDRKHRSISFDKDDGRFSLELHYPRVENYCLMSPTECYTDFHIDFHGTSVWYHVKRGQKIFWIVEPSEQNIKMYEEYLKNSEQSGFFGDVPDKCHRVVVNPGNTLIIPSGWIHAVFTPKDSLVFGGNFLHSRSVAMQIAVLQSENRIGINKRYRYPHSEEATFHMMSQLVKKCTGREYVRPQSKNLQDAYKEYVGEHFIKAGGHTRIPQKQDYADDGKVWQDTWPESDAYVASRAKLAPHEKKDEKEMDGGATLDANGLEAEAVTDEETEGGSMPSLSPKKEPQAALDPKQPTTLEEMDEMIAEEEERKKRMEKEKDENRPVFGGHDDFFIDNLTFYHPESFNCDAGPGLNAMHTMPVSHAEPKMIIDYDILRKAIPTGAVPELERLVQYTLRKPKVEIPYGLTRPNSLIWALTSLLKERRALAIREESASLPSCILPDARSNLMLHQQQVAAEAERKKRAAERRAAAADGEYDTDYDPSMEDKPRPKKARRSGGPATPPYQPMIMKTIRAQTTPAAAAAATPKPPRPPPTEHDKFHKQCWNKGFYAWYKEAKGKYAPEFSHLEKKQVREAVRKTYWVPLTKEEKSFWIARGQEQYKDGFEDEAATSTALAAAAVAAVVSPAAAGAKAPLPGTLMTPEPKVPPHTVANALLSFELFYERCRVKYETSHPGLPTTLLKEFAHVELWKKTSPEFKKNYEDHARREVHDLWLLVRAELLVSEPARLRTYKEPDFIQSWLAMTTQHRISVKAYYTGKSVERAKKHEAAAAAAAAVPSTSRGGPLLSPAQQQQQQLLQQAQQRQLQQQQLPSTSRQQLPVAAAQQQHSNLYYKTKQENQDVLNLFKPQKVETNLKPGAVAAFNAIRDKLAREGRLTAGGDAVQQQQQPTPEGKKAITDEMSLFLLDWMLTKENEILFTKRAPSTNSKKAIREEYENKMHEMLYQVNARFQKEIDADRVRMHVNELLTSFNRGDLKRRKERTIPFIQSVERIFQHMNGTDSLEAELRATAASGLVLMAAPQLSSVIGVKPLEEVMKPSSPVEQPTASAIGLIPPPPSDTVEDEKMEEDTVAIEKKEEKQEDTVVLVDEKKEEEKEEDTVVSTDEKMEEAEKDTVVIAEEKQEDTVALVDEKMEDEEEKMEEEKDTVVEKEEEQLQPQITMESPLEKVKMDVEEAEGKDKSKEEKEKENGSSGLEKEEDTVAKLAPIESDFREATCQPKPPEEGGGGTSSPPEGATEPPEGARSPPADADPSPPRPGFVTPEKAAPRQPSASPAPQTPATPVSTPARSVFGESIESSPMPMMRPEDILTPRRRKKKEKEGEDKEEVEEARREQVEVPMSPVLQQPQQPLQQSSTGGSPAEVLKTPRKRGRPRKIVEKVEDEKKEEEDEKEEMEESKQTKVEMEEEQKEEEEEIESSADEGSTVSPMMGGKRRARDCLWERLKEQQQEQRVRNYTTDPADWTAFDVFLAKYYKRLCTRTGREPSQNYALYIKRERWNVFCEEARAECERTAREWREAGKPREYWGSETVVEQEDRFVTDDKGRQLLPLGGNDGIGRARTESECSSQPPLLIKQEDDEHLEEAPVRRESQDEEMIDVEGMEEDASAASVEGGATASSSSTSIATTTTTMTASGGGEGEGAGGEEKKVVKGKPGRPKKEPASEKKKKAVRPMNEDFMQSATTPRGKGKKAKPDPTKPLIVDGVPVNPLAEPAVANAYGYDPAKDIVPLGQGQLKSAYRRGKAQLDTPHIDAKRYKLEVKHDHLLDDDDHDDTHRGEDMEGVEESGSSTSLNHRPTTPHGGGGEMMEGMNVQIGDHQLPDHPISPAAAAPQQHSPFQMPQQLQQRSASFTRRPVQPVKQAPPPLIPHAPSPLAARRLTTAAADGGWAAKSGGGGLGGRRRSDGEWRDRDRTPGGRSPSRKSSQFSPAEMPPSIPTTPTTPAAFAAAAAGMGGGGGSAGAAARQTKLSQAEQFTMAAPKVIETPRLATPIGTTSSTSSLTSVGSQQPKNGDEPLPTSQVCRELERITNDILRANAILAGSCTNNGN